MENALTEKELSQIEYIKSLEQKINKLLGKTIRKGSVVIAELPDNGRYVQKGKRHCVVVSNDIGNELAGVIIVIPFTASEKKPLPTHVNVEHELLYRKNTALCEQIITIPKTNVEEIICQLDKVFVKRINDAIKISLGMED